MAWATLRYSRDDVNRAAEVLLASAPVPEELEHALEIVNNWRATHAYPLNMMVMTLKNRAKKVESTALVAQRTKRIPAIVLKLRNNHQRGMVMKLTQMHDIGGCRAVLRSPSAVERLVRVYEEATAKNALRGGRFHRKYDYISTPKPDGYRSVHLVYKYHSTTRAHGTYNDLKIEIQLRSKLQHAWATAVETVDFFTGQALKSSIGELDWKRFFALVSSEFARAEKRPLVPGTPSSPDAARAELRTFSRQIALIEGLRQATQRVESAEGQLFLLELDVTDRTLRTTAFRSQDATQAQQAYLALEKDNRDRPEKQAVLVSVDTLAQLPRAYPNYYLDVGDFHTALNRLLA